VKPELADTRPIFLIHHPDLINELDLRGKGREKSGLFYFTFNELTNCIDKIAKEGRKWTPSRAGPHGLPETGGQTAQRPDPLPPDQELTPA